MWLQLFFVLCCLYASYADSCITPLGQKSDCIPIEDCEPLLSALRSNLNEQTADFLRQSKCGCEEKNTRMCCGPLPTDYNKETLLKNIEQDSLEDSYLDNQCGKNTEGDRIFGGTRTMVGEFPWLALLWYRKHNDGKLHYKCGGMLINRRYVLTAGHCIFGKYLDQFGKLVSVRLGEHDVRKDIDCDDICGDPPQDIKVLHSYPHPGFSDGPLKHNDIGLIKLARRATYSDFVQPICLDKSAQWNIGDEVVISGWGKTLNEISSPEKIKISLPIADQADCSQKFRTLHKIEILKTQLCIGGAFSKDACTGDSGGPAMRQRNDSHWEAIAVVSFGYGCGRDGWPAVYTVISSYYEWIVNTLRNTNICPQQ